MVDQKHKPKWHVPEKQHARAVRRPTIGARRIISHHMCAPRFLGVSLRRQAPIAYVAHVVCHAAKSIVKGDGGQRLEPKAVARDVRRDADFRTQGCVRYLEVEVMKNKAGALEEIAVALGGSQTPSLTLPRKPGRDPGHACREDVP